jgi:hypothetical protein
MARTAKATSVEVSGSELYERDYYAWIRSQVSALRGQRVEEIDWANVAEEIEDLGKSEKRSIESRMGRIVEHLLKLGYSPARVKSLIRRGWELSIREARRQIRRRLSESPSLRRKTREMFPHAYEGGRNAALIALNLPDSALPETSPWTLEQILDNGFLPNGSTNSRPASER